MFARRNRGEQGSHGAASGGAVAGGGTVNWHVVHEKDDWNTRTDWTFEAVTNSISMLDIYNVVLLKVKISLCNRETGTKEHRHVALALALAFPSRWLPSLLGELEGIVLENCLKRMWG